MTLGVVCYLLGFPLIFSEKKTVSWLKKWMKDDISLRLIGALIAILAILLLKMKWTLSWDAEGLVILLAWLTLIKGIFLTWWPDIPAKTALSFLTPATALLAGFALIVWGALLTFLGFVLI